nr:hypothetical protein [Mycoplasmopsis bovis]
MTILVTSLKSTRFLINIIYNDELFKIYGFNETLNKANKRVFDGITILRNLIICYNHR